MCIVERVPKHRIVSTLGYVSDGMCIEKLQAEGFTILPAKGNRTERVLDYKKYLFDFKKASTVNKAVLDQIQREGLHAFLPDKFSFFHRTEWHPHEKASVDYTV